jgi:hypothetical protein
MEPTAPSIKQWTETKAVRKARKALLKASKTLQQTTESSDSKYYVLCLKHGTKYTADYVNRLHNMVKRNCTLDFEFVCLTENPNDLNKDITVLPLPERLTGWWCKPYMFSNDLPLNGTVLYIDLDVVISSNIDKLFLWNPTKWCTIRDFTRVMRPEWPKYNSSVVRFNTGQLSFVWDNYAADPDVVQRKFYGDQDYLYEVAKDYPATTYPDEWIMSWKWEIRKSKELGRGTKGTRKLAEIENVVPSDECCIAVFHGDPNPHNCDDPWVKENWK